EQAVEPSLSGCCSRADLGRPSPKLLRLLIGALFFFAQELERVVLRLGVGGARFLVLAQLFDAGLQRRAFGGQLARAFDDRLLFAFGRSQAIGVVAQLVARTLDLGHQARDLVVGFERRLGRGVRAVFDL